MLIQSAIFFAILVTCVLLRTAYASYVWRDEGLFILVALAGVACRIAVGIINHYVGPLPGAEIDAAFYDGQARVVAQTVHLGGEYVLAIGRVGYSSILAAGYIVGGDHYLVPTLINIVFFTEFLLLVYALARRFCSVNGARVVVALTALYPTGLIYTSVPLREAPLMWGLVLYISGLVGVYERRYSLANWRIVLGMGFTVWLHDGFALALVLVPIAFWFRYGELPAWKRALALSSAVILIGGVFFKFAGFFQKLPSNPALLLQPEFLAAIRQRKTSYGISYGVFTPTWGGILGAIPVVLFGFIAAPFPFWLKGFADLPKAVEGIMSLVLTIWAVAAAARPAPKPVAQRRRFLLAMFMFLVMVFAIGSGNSGIAARHRAKFIWIPALLIFSAGRQEQLAGVATAGRPAGH